MTKRALSLWQKLIVASLVLSFVFTDLGALLQLPLVPEVPVAQAASFPAIKVESFDQNVTTDGSTFTLTSDVGATSSAFIRMLTGTRKSSAGPTGSTANTGPDIGTVGLVLSDTATVTVKRVNSTEVKVMGEVWRYEGVAGGANEFIVRDRVAVSLTGASQSTAISGVSNVDKVVPFVTGYTVNDSAVGNWEAATIAAHMDDLGNLVVSRNNSVTAATVYVDVVEFTGSDWTVCHGYSNAHDTAEETVTLNTDSDGQGAATCDVTDWGTATIVEATMEGDSVETGLSDTLALVRPGANTTSVVFDLQQDANARNDGQAWIHVLQNDNLVVTRNSNTNIAEGNGTYGTAAWPTGATTTAALDTLSLEWFTDSSGVGTAHMRGGLHARITDPTGTIQHWVHRSGNTVGVEYGVVELAGLISITNDIFVSATGTQVTSVESPATDVYAGGGFVIQEQTTSRNVTSIAVTESGTVDGQNGLNNIKLFYDLDTTGADGYDCSSESYNGTESQFGATDTSGFSAADGISSFSDSVTISPTQTMCVYVVYDVTSSAADGDTIELSINDPVTDIAAAGSPSIGPVTSVTISGGTTVQNSELTQIHYHWREDNGSETTASSVEGSEDTPAGGFQAGAPRRLRMEVSVEGSATSTDVQYRLQYGEKVGSCNAISTWTDVGESGGAWDVYDSPNVTDGANTTDIGLATGGVSNEEVDFYGVDAQVDNSDKSTSTILKPSEFIELEYTVIPTSIATEGTTYCFRVTDETPDVTHSYRLPLTVQSSQVLSNQTNFPVYVDLNSLGSHFFSNVQADGGDIRVTTDDGVTEVAREIESINVGGSTGEMYFLAPTISSSTDTTFYIYYGSGTEDEYQASSTWGTNGVWSNSYSAVYHLSESGTSYFDSTINSNTGIGEAIDPSVTTGKIGSGQDFGANGRIDLGTGPSVDLNAAGEYYVSAWVNLDSSTADQSPVSQYDGTGDFLFWADAGGTGTGFCHYNGSYMPANCADLNNQNIGSWQYIAAYHDGTSGGVYLDGAETGTGPAATTFGVDTAMRFAIGATDGDDVDRYLDGQIDEVRIAEVSFGRDWSNSEYINQNTPTTFYSTSTFDTLNNSPATILYSAYPEASITSDITVSASSSQVTTLDVGATSQYVGGTFVIERPGTSRTLTDITITETGTVDAQNDLDNISIYYDLDTTAPYDCTGEVYNAGSDTQWGATDTDGFSSANGTSTFTGSQTLTSTQAFCGYVVLDVGTGAGHGDTINIEISDPSSDVVVTSSSVGPSSVVSPTGSTTIAGPILTQTHYHWRNDNGDETDNHTGASSATGGVEDTAFLNVPKETTIRLRTQVSNEGTVSSQATNYRLEYGTKVLTCADIGVWQQVGVGSAFATSASAFIADGNTTDLSTATSGAMTNENTTFVGTGALRESVSESGAITLSSTQFTELEFAIEATAASGYDTDYCFRVTDAGAPVNYTAYAELTTREKQDYFVQRGTEVVSGTGVTLTAGVDYVTPAATSSAFVRITSSQLTGVGNNTGGGTLQADDVTAYLTYTDITQNFTISRPSTATGVTVVDWEIIEYIGLAGADNEMIVRDVGTVNYGTTDTVATGTSLTTVTDNSDVVVFITGQRSNEAGTAFYPAILTTSEWNSATGEPVFRRDTTGVVTDVSYAVVEYTGINWNIQRVEHNYSASGVTETENITAINSVSRAFVHAQVRTGITADNGLAEVGHKVWISSIGAVSFSLGSATLGPTEHYSVAWVIENTQTGNGAMAVYRDNDSVDGTETVEPRISSFDFNGTVNSISNASLWITNDTTGNGNAYPRPMLGATVTSTTQYQIFESDAGQTQVFRVAVVQWPVAELAFEQNYYQFYVDNDTATPTDPWPVGVSNLGENTSITGADDPLGEGDRVRIRMTLNVNNASWPDNTVSFKLQYGRRDGASCSAISTWNDVGAAGSGEIWRGYDATPADGLELSSTLISVANYAATYEEENNSAVNPNFADIDDDVEYDWLIEHNGATQLSDYCFRMVESDGTLLAAYNNYPTIRTTGYTPIVGNWRWYDDINSVTPASAMAPENTTPIDLAIDDQVRLRVTATEVEGAPGNNVKFRLQYSEFPDFSDGGHFVTASTSCTASSTWCYTNGGGIDNATITATVLSDPDSCVAGVGDGCGTYNEHPTSTSSFGQASLSSTEFDFAIQQKAARANAVYYFRLYDVTNDASTGASSTYPSVQIEGSSLVSSVAGLNPGVATEGIISDATSTATSIEFGTVPVNTEYEVAHRVSVNTNATEGYQVLMYSDQGLTNTYGGTVPVFPGTNATPLGWSANCSGNCFGYHAGDDLLENGSNRFAANDTYAAVPTTTPDEIMYSSVPVNESHDIIYKIQVDETQPAGDYESTITYIYIPVF